jgi:hypothetical protein
VAGPRRAHRVIRSAESRGLQGEGVGLACDMSMRICVFISIAVCSSSSPWPVEGPTRRFAFRACTGKKRKAPPSVGSEEDYYFDDASESGASTKKGESARGGGGETWGGMKTDATWAFMVS